MNSDMPLVLAGDIGGTNSRFALFPAHGCGRNAPPAALVSLPTGAFPSFEALLCELSRRLGASVSRAQAAAVAVAGPVERGRFCRPPNIDFTLDLDALPDGLLPRRAQLLNDFTAQALGCREEAEADLVTVLPGPFDAGQTQAVIGAGTGLGKGVLLPDGRGGCLVLPSEGGHAAFPFVGRDEADFEAFVLARTREPYARWETVVSGSGLALTHAFLTGQDLDPSQVSATVGENDPTAAWFARFYGRACRDWALETLPLGGLFVCAGVAAKNLWSVRHRAFADEFTRSHTHEQLLKTMGVRLVRNELAGLRGAAGRAVSLAAREEGVA